MPWAEVHLRMRGQFAGEAEECLESLGALAVTLQDHADDPVLEPAPGTTPLWPTVQLRGLFPEDIEREAVLEALMALPGIARGADIEWRIVKDRDWERAWMDRFQPMRFGRKLWIVPSGMEAPADPDAMILKLDPGLAFGTGTHPTTALCLEWLDGQDLAGQFVVDYGCGSGVLAVAAALKGAARVLCVDIDPQALEATAENARRNGVDSLIEGVLAGDELELMTSADVMLANILAAPLVELAPLLGAGVRPGGRIVLSGILEEQADGVAAAYAAAFPGLRRTFKEGWVRIDGARKDAAAQEPKG